MTNPVHLLAVGKLPPFLAESLEAAFTLHHLDHPPLTAELAAIAPEIRGIAGTGQSSISAALIDSLPALEVISIFGVGYDRVDMAAAGLRNIAVTNTPDVLTDDVADLAIGLLVALARGVAAGDRFVRDGRWPQGPFPFTRRLGGATLGIVGLGRIGLAIARRAEAFGMTIAYCNRHPRAGLSYAFHATPADLAGAADFLMVAVPGGPATGHLIDAAVLEALGPEGMLINIARGSVVDEAALIEALQAHKIAGAALDVFACEPNVPQALLALPNLVLTPHIGSATNETRHAMADLAFANLQAHFAGRPLLTPVPETLPANLR